jgi:hypothetical protein
MKVMKAKEMSEEVYDQLIRLDYHRKINSVWEVTTSVDFKSLDKETRHAIDTFPILLFNSETDLMGIENLDGEQQFYILFIGGRNYLVDTQGYTYPRYIIELENLEFEEDEDDIYERMEGLVRITDSKIFNEVVKNLDYELQQEGFDREDILNYLELKLAKAFGSAQ